MSASLPEVGVETPLRLPQVRSESLRNGLKVVVARRPNVPRVEVRLLLPAGIAADHRREGAAAWMLAETLFAGTRSRTSLDIAAELQRLGGEVFTRAADDFLFVSGGVLSANLRPYLELVAESLLGPNFPDNEVAIARTRLVQRLVEQRADPGFIANESLWRRMLDSHPYAIVAPPTPRVSRTGRDAVRALWRGAVTPAGAILVLVGDVRPAAAVEAARAALGRWPRRSAPAQATRPSPPPRLPPLVVDRRGSVQTNIRFGGVVPRRSEPDYVAALLANMVFGGYFSSRLVENIRERRGYTYAPGSGFGEHRAASFLLVRADVRNDVTAAALTEIRYELGRMCSLPVEPAELEGAKRYLLGIQALGLQSQQGLAGQLAALEAYGVGPEFLARYRREVARVTARDVLAAARRYLAPSALTCVLVGDAGAIARDVDALEPVELAPRKR